MMGHELKRVAQLEVAKTLLAVERYRLAHASLPETLDQLVPDYLAAVPLDPFDGAPLRYKRLDRGFLVYSVGEDGKDDGGKREPPKETRNSGETWDLVFRVERQGWTAVCGDAAGATPRGCPPRTGRHGGLPLQMPLGTHRKQDCSGKRRRRIMAGERGLPGKGS